MQTFTFSHPTGDTVFLYDDQHIWLERLFGMTCGNSGDDSGPRRTQGLAILAADLGRFEGDRLPLAAIEPGQDQLSITWQAAGATLRLFSTWTLDPSSGVISRRDRLMNTGQEPIRLRRCQARFAFSPARYQVYCQESRWCAENQGFWLPLQTGAIQLGNEWGRTTRAGTPFICLREIDGERGVAFHLLPRGNYTIRARLLGGFHTLPLALLELGQADEDLNLRLAPGEILELPELLIQGLPGGDPTLAAPRLHDFALRRFFASARQEPPVVYNTWFYMFDYLELSLLRQQLAAAKEIGCEVFVIDAGWFAPGAPGWGGSVGDWREKTEAAFHGKMAEFAAEVRNAGLGFGLWMEPERFGPKAPIRQEHPNWFIADEHNLARIDLENPQAYAYLRGEIFRLLETYQLAWMKIDFNFELGYDGSGAELLRYYQHWYRLVEEVRQRFPQVFIEGCSSGGMRLELHSLSHFDGHFLSDTVNPVDVLRILQGALLRLPPGRLTHWAVLRSAGDQIPVYSDPMSAQWPQTLITPRGAGWQPSETVDIEFALLAELQGIFGLSGDLAGLPQTAREQVQWAVSFYKHWRKLISGSIAHLLTPLRPLEDRQGWIGLQLQNPQDTNSLLYAYRLVDARFRLRFQPRALDPQATYRVQQECAAQRDQPPIYLTGRQLMSEGIAVELPGFNQAAIWSMIKEHRAKSL